jgi:hypothetical protein
VENPHGHTGRLKSKPHPTEIPHPPHSTRPPTAPHTAPAAPAAVPCRDRAPFLPSLPWPLIALSLPPRPHHHSLSLSPQNQIGAESRGGEGSRGGWEQWRRGTGRRTTTTTSSRWC